MTYRADFHGRPQGHRNFVRPEDDPPGTSRLFIAVPLPDEVRARVGELMGQVAGGQIEERAYGQPRWVRVEGLHLTLRFLGATPDGRIEELGKAIERAASDVPAFDAALAGAGAFPSQSRPRVLWLGIVEGADRLGLLAAGVAEQLTPMGWPPDDRPFQAHLTLARTDGVPGADAAAERLIQAAQAVRLTWQVDRLVLYKSVLGRGPARYEVLAEARLG